jgi:polyisoprenoid-binding protein YceI
MAKNSFIFMARGLFITALSALAVTGVAHAATYTIDSDHSEVGFKIRHLAISNVNGKFAEFSGSFAFDPANVKSSKVEAEIAIKSVNTSQQKRDDHLRGDDFFSAEKYPQMKFVSKTVEPSGKDQFKLAGDLTIRGVTKPITLNVTYSGSAKDPWGNEKAAFSAVTTISRKDFGLTWNKALETGGMVVGDEVTINLEIEGTKQA